MSSKAKQQRDEWELKMIGVHQTVLEMCAETPIQKRAVTRKMTVLENIWQKLIESHVNYCRSAEIGFSSSESTEFLREIERLRGKAIQVAEKALEVEDVDVVKARRLRKTVEQLKSEIDVAISTLEEFDVEEQLTRNEHEEAMNMVKGAIDKMNRYVEVSREAEDTMEDTASEELFGKTIEAFKKHWKLLLQLKFKILKNAPVKQEIKPTVGSDQLVSVNAAGSGMVQKQPVKIKPLDCPKQILNNISTLTNSSYEKYGKPEMVAREVWSLGQTNNWVVVIMATKVLSGRHADNRVVVFLTAKVLSGGQADNWVVVFMITKVLSMGQAYKWMVVFMTSKVVLLVQAENLGGGLNDFHCLVNGTGRKFGWWYLTAWGLVNGTACQLVYMANMVVFIHEEDILGAVYMVMFTHEEDILGAVYMAAMVMFTHEEDILGAVYMTALVVIAYEEVIFGAVFMAAMVMFTHEEDILGAVYMAALVVITYEKVIFGAVYMTAMLLFTLEEDILGAVYMAARGVVFFYERNILGAVYKDAILLVVFYYEREIYGVVVMADREQLSSRRSASWSTGLPGNSS